MKVGDQAAPPYPVSFQRGQHLLPQLDLPGELVHAVAAAQERLQNFIWGRAEGRGGWLEVGSGEEEGGREHADIQVY